MLDFLLKGPGRTEDTEAALEKLEAERKEKINNPPKRSSGPPPSFPKDEEGNLISGTPVVPMELEKEQTFSTPPSFPDDYETSSLRNAVVEEYRPSDFGDKTSKKQKRNPPSWPIRENGDEGAAYSFGGGVQGNELSENPPEKKLKIEVEEMKRKFSHISSKSSGDDLPPHKKPELGKRNSI